jgi:cyanate permease
MSSRAFCLLGLGFWMVQAVALTLVPTSEVPQDQIMEVMIQGVGFTLDGMGPFAKNW